MSASAARDDVLTARALWTCLVGDARETLRSVPDGCARTCVTSPPYFGLRDYGNAAQIGQEPTPRAFVDALVEVFREVRRVLADDGTLWLNIGDSYAGSWGAQSREGAHNSPTSEAQIAAAPKRTCTGSIPKGAGVKPKDLLGIPWRLAFALQDDGWYLRSDIIWAKPNPMPESVTDRPTRAHEYVFLLSKQARYFYDGDAIREQGTNRAPGNTTHKHVVLGGTKTGLCKIGAAETRNARDVWTITPEPCAESHFATMPPDLARRCILAGSQRGDVVLDPFGGAGTTALAALGLGRRALLCELNPDYVEIQKRRLADFDADTSSPIAAPSPEWGALFAAGAR